MAYALGQLYFLLLVIFIVLSAFFALMEAAFLSVQRSRVKHLVTTGVAGGSAVDKIIQRPDRLLATVLFGNNVANTAAAVLGSAIAISLWGDRIGVVVATVVMAIAILIFGDTIPKTFATRHAERVTLILAGPVRLIENWLSPIVTAITWVASPFTGGSKTPLQYLISEEEIRSIITAGQKEGAVEEAEAEMLHKVFEFGDRTVREIMTPRTEVTWVEKGTTLEEFLQIYAESPHSRFPVYADSTDNVVGMVSIKDVLMAQAKGGFNPQDPIDGLTRTIPFVPQTKLLGELLTEMQASGSQIAVVVDEFGGISGIATMEQLLEEIVGEVGDELARSTQEFQAIDERTLEIDGGMRLDEANEKLGLSLPLGEYETVAGFALSCLGHIPKIGEQFKYYGLIMVITEMRGLKIEKIRVIKREGDATLAD
jgi:putative hemolysin